MSLRYRDIWRTGTTEQKLVSLYSSYAHHEYPHRMRTGWTLALIHVP